MSLFVRHKNIVLTLTVSAILCVLVFHSWQKERETLRLNFIQRKSDQAELHAKAIKEKLNYIHQLLRSLADYPSVRGIDRYGKKLTEDSRVSLQQLYRYAYLNVQLSEIYLLPKEMDPTLVDPVTGKPEEPIVMFDDFIAATENNNAEEKSELEEVEIDEYKLIQRQLQYFAQKFPTKEQTEKIIPVVSGESVITCDNTEFTKADLVKGNNDPRKGIVFSSPVYDKNGQFNGAVSAVVRIAVLSRYLPRGDFALTNSGFNIGITNEGRAEVKTAAVSREFYNKLNPIFKKEITFDISDQTSWSFLAIADDAEYFGSQEMGNIHSSALKNLLLIGLVCLGLCLNFHRANVRQEMVREMTETLNGNANELIKISQILKNKVQVLAETSEQQSSATTQISASIKTMTHIINQNYAALSQLISLSNQNAQRCQVGVSKNVEMVKSIKDISSNEESMRELLNGNMQRIESVVHFLRTVEEKTKVINDIVFQTKLLSFNASVEAARAGEMGKGFSVVADEVGKLAQMSGTSAAEISQLIESGANNTKEIIADMGDSVEQSLSSSRSKIHGGLEVAESAAQMLGEISKDGLTINTVVEGLDKSLKEQTVGIKEINQAIEAITITVQEFTPLTAEVDRASEELLGRVQHIETLVHHLKDIA